MSLLTKSIYKNNLQSFLKKMLLILVLITLLNNALASSAAGRNNKHYANSIANFFALSSAKKLIMLDVNGYQQTTDFTCGPAAVMSLLRYYNVLKQNEMNAKTELRIAKEMGTTADKGTNPQQMVLWLKIHGFDVKLGENGTLEMLRDNLQKKTPVIVEWVDWGAHWVVVTGYDIENKQYNGSKDSLFLADSAVHFDNVRSINGLLVFNPDRFASMWLDAGFFHPGQVIKGIYIIATPSTKMHH